MQGLWGGGAPERIAAGLYLGLGGSYNSVKNDQTIFGFGSGDVFSPAGVLVSQATAEGTGIPYKLTQTTFAPEAQVGYLRYINSESKYL